MKAGETDRNDEKRRFLLQEYLQNFKKYAMMTLQKVKTGAGEAILPRRKIGFVEESS
ncbi:hypothetical protein [uncultured Oscillibacter sp.]|uniref:hypothetical protein n=1 Tax=uncultured Oscillibacter sp. TaxID=876091 RepID=UPI0025FB2144|nr:hypothetical protein [uncultured Oscillibacter sp.]